MTHSKKADPPTKSTLYRMVLPDHVCPFGVRAKELLEARQIEFEDRVLSNRKEVDDFEAEHGVDTTPQIFIAGKRIGGCAELEQYLADR
jgi:glutaredoxin